MVDFPTLGSPTIPQFRGNVLFLFCDETYPGYVPCFIRIEHAPDRALCKDLGITTREGCLGTRTTDTISPGSYCGSAFSWLRLPAVCSTTHHESAGNGRDSGTARGEGDPSELLLQLPLQRDEAGLVRPDRPCVLDGGEGCKDRPRASELLRDWEVARGAAEGHAL